MASCPAQKHRIKLKTATADNMECGNSNSLANDTMHKKWARFAKISTHSPQQAASSSLVDSYQCDWGNHLTHCSNLAIALCNLSALIRLCIEMRHNNIVTERTDRAEMRLTFQELTPSDRCPYELQLDCDHCADLILFLIDSTSTLSVSAV